MLARESPAATTAPITIERIASSFESPTPQTLADRHHLIHCPRGGVRLTTASSTAFAYRGRRDGSCMSARRGDNKVWRGLAPHHSITSSARRRNDSEIVRPSAFAHDKDNVVGLVRSRGLEPPRVAPLAPQASASTNSATTADGMNAGRGAARRSKRLDVTNQPPWNKGGPRSSPGRQVACRAAHLPAPQVP